MGDVQALIAVLQSFAARRIAVFGESILDRYLKGRAAGICREAPVPVVGLQAVLEAPGGAANAACNMASLGAQVRFVSLVGADHYGERLKGLLAQWGVDTASVLSDDRRRTVVKQRLRCDDQLVARFDEGDVGPVAPELAERLAEALLTAATDCDGVVVSDYDLGLAGPAVLEALRGLRDRGIPIIVDAKCLPRYRHLRPLLVKPNYDEALRLLGGDGPAKDRAGFISRREGELLEITGARSVIVTVDSEGAVLLGPDGPYRTAGRASPAAYAAGAGDTFLATMALALVSGATTTAAMDLAAAAADIILAYEGTAVCSRDDLGRELAGQGKFLRDEAQVRQIVARARQEGRRVVFTNGCFDILHRGHITYLERAKALGDVLIVGLNDDDSVRRLKGADRPVNPLADRISVVAALGCVDHVLAFEGDTAHEPIRMVRPDLFVKGGDYAAKPLPEVDLVEELGGRVRLLEYVDNNSTSSLIERIRRDAKAG